MFSATYKQARDSFIAALEPAGFTHTQIPLGATDRWHGLPLTGPDGEALTVDVGIRRGADEASVLVTSSGLHGIEGYFGSAAQLALLNDADWLRACEGQTVVMIHALNPFGFAWRRRWNENNVDLNRNFLIPGEEPERMPLFDKLNGFLNPQSPPSRLDPFLAVVVWKILRHGFGNIQRELPVGQYDYPKSIFFGGNGPERTQLILKEHLASWIGPKARHVFHVDFHTALGARGTYQLLGVVEPNDKELGDLHARFGASVLPRDGLQTVPPPPQFANSPIAALKDWFGLYEKSDYPARGYLTKWVRHLLPDVHYRMFVAEWGTYPAIRVLQALRAENRATHFGNPTLDPSKKPHLAHLSDAWTRDDLMEVFVPADDAWRNQVIAAAKTVCTQALGPVDPAPYRDQAA